MRFLIAEFRIAIALVAMATVVPLAWSYRDSRRRLQMSQTTFAECLVHNATPERCVELRPATLAPSTGALCELRYDARTCLRLMEGR